MKYAIIGPKGAINRISDTEPKAVAEGATVVEITDEQAAIVQAGRTSEPKVFYFYKNGELVTMAEHREQLIAARPKPAVTAEKHIEREGYPAIRLVTLMDLEGKLAEAGKTSAKLTAVRSWLDAILGAFAANPEPRNDWPNAPFGFEETVQDAASKLL
jgi:hypothetical protein